MYHLLLLFGAGLVAGLINAIAGGGAIILYPILYSFGVPPIMTNATIAASIWPGSVSSVYGYRKYLKKIPNFYFLLLIPCLIGAIIGANFLRNTPDKNFRTIVPWLIIIAVTLMAFQPKIHAALKRKHKRVNKKSLSYLFAIAVAIFGTSIYGGYFGAGYGIIMLAILGFTRLKDIHQMNAFKNLTSICITLTASIYFAHYGLVEWKYIPVIIIGSVIGGYLGATYSYKLPTHLLRTMIVVIGYSIAIYLMFSLK